ncbi:hypothetical protein Pcinc_028584 [Petrolisthes cinctipes]|uniref:Hermansky-Pudlak syndrome 1 n=1 Tax=Petrolisthes cinctipes TaxID=88211 RepID=A0AAE1K946_PETCI|nr:hypothetical protein Pcinc_028584 [Petrolisthes cinctipes]
MLAVLIFDQLNDVVYLRCDHKFVRHVRLMAASQGLLDQAEVDLDEVVQLDPNIVVQLFSPLVTSQRIMATQFNNPYTSVSCQDGTTIVFQEYAGYLFVGVGNQEESHLQRVVSITIRVVQLIVGPCVTMLKRSEEKSALLDSLLEAWQRLYAQEQSYLVEAVERLVVNAELSAASIKALAAVVDTLRPAQDLTPRHALFFVRNKLLALYSSRNASELTASDLLFLNLLVASSQVKDRQSYTDTNTTTNTKDDDGDDDKTSGPIQTVEEDGDGQEKHQDDGIEIDSSDSGEFFSIPNTPALTRNTMHKQDGNGVGDGDDDGGGGSSGLRGQVLLLKTETCRLTPHLVHLHTLSEGLALVIVSEVNRTQLSVQLMAMLTCVEELAEGSSGGGSSRGRVLLEACDTALKKTHDLARRLPKGRVYDRVEKSLQQVQYRWEGVKRSGIDEWVKSGGCSEDVPSRVDASLTSLIESIRSSWRAACLMVAPNSGMALVEAAVATATTRMADYCHFLEVKALRNMTLGCRSALSISKYLEDFPGLVHFLYVDRSAHQLTAPTLLPVGGGEEDGPATPTRALTLARVWSMVEFARSHLSKGHLSLMWKDTTFSYAYFLWFEDGSSNPMKPEPLDEMALEGLPLPGILCQDFYRTLAARAFPGMDPSRVRAYELFCVHLGLATSPCVLEHTRRLAATIWEVAGPMEANPADLL